MKLKILKDIYWLLRIILIVIILAFLVSVVIVSATPTEIRDEVCSSINLTGTNCTDWWDGFNFTDDNFTYINMTNITVEYIIETHNHHYDYSNDTYHENKTYVYYNQTGNQTYLDNRYVQEVELEGYAKKGEVNTINNTIIETREPSGFTWWNVLTLVIIIGILALAYVLYKVVKEVEYLEAE